MICTDWMGMDGWREGNERWKYVIVDCFVRGIDGGFSPFLAIFVV